LAIGAVAAGAFRAPRETHPSLRRQLLGLDFPNPVGLAAGFDKNADAVAGALALGFGFVEVGTVTPRAQPGNPKPRVFRIVEHGAIINRLGFNNDGFDAVRARLAARGGKGIVGVNIGANHDSQDRAADYVAGVRQFSGVVDYITINISSPNTAGLRNLQARVALTDLMTRVAEARAGAPDGTPVLLKIAPDLDDAGLAGIAEAALAAGIDGIVVSNTTVDRHGLGHNGRAAEAGGLSGRPLFRRSTIMLARMRRIVGRAMVLVGVGGIDSTEAAWSKIAAGADLIQLYTGMIYEGPELARRIVAGLAERLDREGIGSIADLAGSETDRWAAETL
jgi:dihydroorotate dehydrogenase